MTILTYNHVAFLAECLESVVQQQMPFAFEILVGDDASTDGTTTIVKDYAARHPGLIRPIVHPVNVGGGRNWQSVLDAARGEYLAYLDGDDLMYPGKLARQVAFLDENPGVAMCFHNLDVFEWPSGEMLGRFTRPDSPPVRHLDDLVRHGTVYGHSSKMYRSSSLPREGVDLAQSRCGDWLAHIQHSTKGEVAYIDEVLGAYRRHAGGMSSRRRVVDLDAALHDLLYTIEQAKKLGASSDAIADGTGRVLFEMALRYLAAGDVERFRDAVVRSRVAARLGPAQGAAFALRETPRLVAGLAASVRAWRRINRAAKASSGKDRGKNSIP
ncbi:hypothetical protein BH11GEM2_BH11GEM2_30790 [soil metagenome]